MKGRVKNCPPQLGRVVRGQRSMTGMQWLQLSLRSPPYALPCTQQKLVVQLPSNDCPRQPPRPPASFLRPPTEPLSDRAASLSQPSSSSVLNTPLINLHPTASMITKSALFLRLDYLQHWSHYLQHWSHYLQHWSHYLQHWSHYLQHWSHYLQHWSHCLQHWSHFLQHWSQVDSGHSLLAGLA